MFAIHNDSSGSNNSSSGVQVRAHAAATISELRAAAVGQSVFLAERIRRALAKLTGEERWLFSTKLKEGPFEDMLYSDEELLAESSWERAVQVAMAVGVGTMEDNGTDRTRGDAGLGGMVPSGQQRQPGILSGRHRKRARRRDTRLR